MSRNSSLKVFTSSCLVDMDGEFLLSFSAPASMTSQQSPSSPQYHLLAPSLADELRVTVEPQISSKARPTWLSKLPCLSTHQIDMELPDVTADELG